MRPKKPILLYCSDRGILSATAFTLHLQPYDVTAVHNCKEATALAASKDTAFACGVLIHTQQGDPAGRLIHRLLESPSGIPLLLVDRAGDLAPVQYVDMVLYGLNTTMAHILAALQTLSKRRPGQNSRRAA
jgi:hypothetical protein